MFSNHASQPFRGRLVAALTLGGLLAASLAAEPVGLSTPIAEPPLPPWLEEKVAKGGATFEDQVIEQINQERWDNGQLPPLKGNSALDSAAETHSTRMGQQNFFSHCDLDNGDMLGDRLTAAGYFGSSLGENVAAGQSTPQSVIGSWMGSTGHRNNILSTSYREIGHGYYFDGGDQGNVRLDLDSNCVQEGTGGPYRHYWTQTFGRRNSVYPVVIEREAYQTDVSQVDLYLYGSGWAVDMRLRNAGGSWTAWQPFSTNVLWQLSAGGGTKQVDVEIRNGSGTVLGASDTIFVAGDPDFVFGDGFESGNTTAWTETSP